MRLLSRSTAAIRTRNTAASAPLLRQLTDRFKPATTVLAMVSLIAIMQPVTSVAAETPLDSIIAVVNDDIILNSEFTRERDTMLRQNQPGLPRGEELHKLVVERLIIRSIQLQEAERRNIRIDESGLQRAIEDMAANANMTPAEMRDSITGEGLDFLMFREDLRKNLTVSTLTRREIQSNLFVSDAEVEELLSTNKSSGGEFLYTLEHLLVKLPQQADTRQDTAALGIAQSLASRARDGETFAALVRSARSSGTDIEGGNLGTQSLEDMPELFAREMNGLQENDVTEPLRSVAGYHVLKLLSRTTINQATPSRVRARHILVSTRGGRTSTEAQQRIREVQEQLNSGRSFAEVAEAYSDDDSSAAKGGSLGWFGGGEMVAEFEQAAFTTPVNVLSQPFKTAFGWHVLEVLEQQLPESSAEADAAKAREQLRQKKGEERYNAWLSSLRDNAYVELRGFAKRYQ